MLARLGDALSEKLDYDLVWEGGAPLYMGELPNTYRDAPAQVIINACGVVPALSVPSPTVLVFPMVDTLEAEYIPSRQRIEALVDAAHVFASAEPTYWHCHAGLNRSGLLVATYLHRHGGLRISDAIQQLRGARSPMVLCNNVFERTLRDWYGGEDEQLFSPFDLSTYLRERVRRRERGKE